MKTLLLVLGLLYAFSAAGAVKVMNFNTMCDLCGNKKDYGPFKERLKNIADTINRHDPDLVSLQEFSNIRQVRKVLKKLKTSYHQLYADGKILNFTDPVLLIRKERFEVKDQGGFWLGPNPRFPLGWKLAIPRRVHWARLMDKSNGTEFIFIGSHFDNNSANKTPSSLVMNERFQNEELPILFAGDTNLKTSHEGYQNLLEQMVDTFPGTEKVEFYANGKYEIHDACNKSKAATFPECRIDHVLISPQAPWRVKSWGVDVFRYKGKLGFVSDHRAVIVTLE